MTRLRELPIRRSRISSLSSIIEPLRRVDHPGSAQDEVERRSHAHHRV